MISKTELRVKIKRMMADPNKPISDRLFAELAGISYQNFMDVFVKELHPMSQMMHVRVAKALERLEKGEVRVMRNRDKTRFIEYLKVPKPPLRKETRLSFSDGEFKVKLGLVNRADYSRPTLKEELKGE